MAHFWIQELNQDAPRWAALPLAGAAYRFINTPPFVSRAAPVPARGHGESLVRIDHEGAEKWLLVVPPASPLCVNGRKALLGSCILTDRDEVYLGTGRRLYFSTERMAHVVPFPGADREMICARCRTPIAQGSPAVACPACGAWCHQTEELPCWSYPGTTHCPLCDQTTEAEAGYRWTPQGL